MKIEDIDVVYVMNLRKATERWAKFQQRIAAAKLPFSVQRFEAIDGSKATSPKWWGAGNGAWGCYRTQLNILESAINLDANNILIFEDDVEFVPSFVDKLKQAMAELPSDWDFFYIGGQHLKESEQPPVVISPHISRAYNVNRCHAYMMNGKSFATIYQHLLNYDCWSPKHHIDHHYGVLCETGVVNVYTAQPWLCGQVAGHSFITGGEKKSYYWYATPKQAVRQICDGAAVLHYTVAFGDIGLLGKMGYENSTVNCRYNAAYISAHASSRITLKLDKPKYIFAFMNPGRDAQSDIIVAVNEKKIGVIRRSDSYTEAVQFLPGIYSLSLKVQGGNENAHTVWGLRDEPITPVTSVAYIDILMTSKLSTQFADEYMFPYAASNPGYSYTVDDAKLLLSELERRNLKACINLTGGEAGLWPQLKEVARLFKESPNILCQRIDLWDIDAVCIDDLKPFFDCIDTNNKRVRYEWPYRPVYGNGICSLSSSFTVVGSNVWPCMLYGSLVSDGKWLNSQPVKLVDYLDGRVSLGAKGKFEACTLCPCNCDVQPVAAQIK